MPEYDSPFVSNEEIVLAARKNLNQGAWDYLVGGSESETTLRRNRLAFDRWGFRPRILVDVSKIDTSTTFLGEKMRIPAMLAPVGSLQTFTPEGGAAAARAAAEFGTVHCVSSVTEPSWEETAAAGAKFFQLYVQGDDDWARDAVQRIKAAGYTALAITVDVAIYSRRERPMLNRWAPPTRRALPGRNFLSELTWRKLDVIKEAWGDMPLMVKGVATVEDALLCIEHGVEVIWVSNHGGRQLDHGLGSMDVLPEIVQAVGDKAQVILDGGIQRGSDIVKAIALGARCVALGRLQAWALGAAGQAGCLRMLEILENEMISAMGLMGVTSLDQLNDRYVCRAEPVIPPHEMSMWANMPTPQGPGGRLL
ncbi:MAG TPA: alpha-hydroxy acid oxidase [Dehalococcoidia bacterium]|nr:alpha-hydroxy acid oxidase [Dehalococcoidia bacterium]